MVAPLVLAQQPEPLPAPMALTVLRSVDAHYNHLASMQTRFTERYTGMGQTRTESGTLLLKKPGRMAFLYDTPVGKVFLFDGRFAWFYTPGDRAAQRIPAKQMDDLRSPLRFLLGHTQLQRELDNPSVTPAPGSTFVITGVPHGMSQHLKALSLTVTPTGEITHMALTEIDGATTGFDFTNTRDGLPIPDSVFTFKPPQGVAVVAGSTPI